MVIDVTVGNPPYNYDQYTYFVKESHCLSNEYTLMIIPAKWQCKHNSKTELFRKEVAPYIQKIVYYPDCSDIFKYVSEASGICYCLIRREINDEQTIKEVCHTNKMLNTGEVARHSNNMLLEIAGRSIISKTCGYTKFMLPNDTYLNCVRYGILVSNAVIVGGCKTSGTYLLSYEGKIQIIAKGRIIDLQEKGIKTKGRYRVIFGQDRLAECESVYSYIHTKFIRFLLFCGRCGNSITSDVAWRYVPVQERFDHIFTDDELYRKYKLTKEEISLIESLVSDIN